MADELGELDEIHALGNNAGKFNSPFGRYTTPPFVMRKRYVRSPST